MTNSEMDTLRASVEDDSQELNGIRFNMTLNIDEYFVSLDEISKAIGNLDQGIKLPHSKPQEREESWRSLESIEDIVKQRMNEAKHILEFGSDTSSLMLSSSAISELLEIRELKEQRRLTELAIEVNKMISESPSRYSAELMSTLASLTGSNNILEIEQLIVDSIRDNWYNLELRTRKEGLKSILTRVGWPAKTPPRRNQDFADAFTKLLELELPSVHPAFDVLVQPITERILFNFNKKQDTARSDKPEWLFSYLFKLLDPLQEWIFGELRRFVDDPMDKVTLALVPTIATTCRSIYDINTHFVEELIQFADQVAAKYLCSPQTIDEILHSILDESRLRSFIASEANIYDRLLMTQLRSGSRSIDFDADVPSAKPTFLALNIRQMIQQADFLLRLDAPTVIDDIQMKIIRSYVSWLENEMSVYEKSQSSLARAVSTNKDILPKDVSVLEYLARIFGSASFFKGFLEMWGLEYIVASTGVNLTDYIGVLDELRAKSAARIASVLTRDAQKQLKSYFRLDWGHMDNEDGESSSRPIINSVVSALKVSISFLNRICSSSKSDRARVLVLFADSLANMLWRLVIQANVFNAAAARLIKLDVEMLWLSLDLPEVKFFVKVIEATDILETGVVSEASSLSMEEVEGLLSRRMSKKCSN